MPLIKLDDGGRGQRVGAQEIRGWERTEGGGPGDKGVGEDTGRGPRR